MGQGEEVKTRSEPAVEIQERGEIFFFYRPKVDKEEAHSPDDVQRLYIVMRPESGERPVEEKQDPTSGKEGAKNNDNEDHNTSPKNEGGGRASQQPLLRFLVIGKKMLPEPSRKGQPFWGYVELVTTKTEDVKDALKGEEYDTATRGHRHKPPARALGEGIYRILRHNPAESQGKRGRTHTHLIYKLVFPPENEKNEPQESLNVEREGSYIIQVKNPDQQGDGERGGGGGSRWRGLQNKRKAMFPAQLQGQMGQRRWCPADPPDFLNYEGCEFLLISASYDIEEELGLELKPDVEGNTLDASCLDLVKTFGVATRTDPLVRGTWV